MPVDVEIIFGGTVVDGSSDDGSASVDDKVTSGIEVDKVVGKVSIVGKVGKVSIGVKVGKVSFGVNVGLFVDGGSQVGRPVVVRRVGVGR